MDVGGKRQVSSRLGEAVLGVTLTESSAIVSPRLDYKFQPCKHYPRLWATPKSAGSRTTFAGRRRSNEASVLKLHVAHPVTRTLRGYLLYSVQLATLSPFWQV